MAQRLAHPLVNIGASIGKTQRTHDLEQQGAIGQSCSGSSYLERQAVHAGRAIERSQTVGNEIEVAARGAGDGLLLANTALVTAARRDRLRPASSRPRRSPLPAVPIVAPRRKGPAGKDWDRLPLSRAGRHFRRAAASLTMLRSAYFLTSMLDFRKPRSAAVSTLRWSAPRSGNPFGSR